MSRYIYKIVLAAMNDHPHSDAQLLLNMAGFVPVGGSVATYVLAMYERDARGVVPVRLSPIEDVLDDVDIVLDTIAGVLSGEIEASDLELAAEHRWLTLARL